MYEKFENTDGLIRNSKSKKDIQYNGQQKGDERTNNDLQNTTQKTKDWATRTQLVAHVVLLLLQTQLLLK
jgi:hypothetical protein